MRHGKKFNHLGRTNTHRRAMLSNMACSLILSKRIITTVQKAKSLRKFVEPILTCGKSPAGKSPAIHKQRQVFSRLSHNKEATKELFNKIGDKIANRAGGYTRIIKLDKHRLGDSAAMCLIELVDYSDYQPLRSVQANKGSSVKKRTRRGGDKKGAPTVLQDASPTLPEQEAKPVVEQAPERVPTPTDEPAKSRDISKKA